MKRIRFVKDIEVVYWDSRYDDEQTRHYRRGTMVFAEVEPLDKDFVNLKFQDGNEAVDVPISAFEVVV